MRPCRRYGCLPDDGLVLPLPDLQSESPKEIPSARLSEYADGQIPGAAAAAPGTANPNEVGGVKVQGRVVVLVQRTPDATVATHELGGAPPRQEFVINRECGPRCQPDTSDSNSARRSSIEERGPSRSEIGP